MNKKETVKEKFLVPKVKLRQERLSRELTTTFMADLIGLKNRRQYELKEKGEAPFKDYEIAVISQYFKIPENELFF
ncbi:hypothetical protein Javan290_0060 [Streptococcus phage Javan290]|uniref:pathogenicity island protein n=1 Tax=Streptococcus marmotae TaxID=1825069 RepID=UPI00083751F9|nr:pathogenicity island protein [Streptococcus marmotae]QBX26114.1 hypothetical protein Javan290_0060 [Streptococcus phage Javan290]